MKPAEARAGILAAARPSPGSASRANNEQTPQPTIKTKVTRGANTQVSGQLSGRAPGTRAQTYGSKAHSRGGVTQLGEAVEMSVSVRCPPETSSSSAPDVPEAAGGDGYRRSGRAGASVGGRRAGVGG